MIMVGERDSDITEVECKVKVRRPWAVATLTALSLGIYSPVWVYKVNRELRDYGAARGDERLAESRPWRSVLAVTVGGLVVIPALVAYVHTIGRLQDAERVATGERRAAWSLMALWIGSTLLSIASGVAGYSLVLSLVTLGAGLAAIALTQARLNGVWRKSGLAGALSFKAGEVASG
ncbi:MAG TPA: hypothetical protein VLP43_03490 [Solirubrobacteraceae bacterium]|nr:hypothetical protein [Solirubrobacteraceae bacterium]